MRVFPLASLVLLSACPAPQSTLDAGAPPTGRCDVDWRASGLFALGGTGARAQVISSPAELIGGPSADGRPGDVLLANEQVRFVIEQPGRSSGPMPSGGGLIDADLARAGAPGRDQLERTGLFYGMGRLASVRTVEVLADGSEGGPAVVAATGTDVQHDFVNINTMLFALSGLDVTFVVDPTVPRPLRTTTYYVLSPGESRVRVLTQFCNEGAQAVLTPLLEVFDLGAPELFLPGGCRNALGTAATDATRIDPNLDCLVESTPSILAQGDGVAYGLRFQRLDDLSQLSTTNAFVGYGGVLGNWVEGGSLQGMLSWTDPDARTRPGALLIRPGQSRGYLRDLTVGSALADVQAAFDALDGAQSGRAVVSVTVDGASPAPGARVAVKSPAGALATLGVADEQGRAELRLRPGAWELSAALPGHGLGPGQLLTVTAGASQPLALTVPAARRLTVAVKDPAGAASPAKVTVYCSGGPCPFAAADLRQHQLVEDPPFQAAAIGLVPVSGQLTLALPPGEYDVVVTRGPEFSAWPETWPASARHVDLRQQDATLDAVVGRVVDSSGWLSADLHVHAARSADSSVTNEHRAARFLAEGVDVLVSTDHEYLTDYAPVVRALGAEHLMATVVGEELTTVAHGHYNVFPMQRRALATGGAFDHAAGEDAPTYRLPQLFPAIKAEHPGAVVQLNHARGMLGALTLLRVDTATLASHGDAANFNMAPAPDATVDDARLFGDGFDALETATGTSPSPTALNDWMTFLSRGTVRTATAVSDTHKGASDHGGYSRTWVQVPDDEPARFQPGVFAEQLRARRAFASNGPFLRVTARRLDGLGQPVGEAVAPGGTLSLPAGDFVEVTVDVQAPEWVSLTRAELHSHAPGREAVNGEANGSWPEGRILQVRPLDSLAALEAVPGTSLRRVHVVERFVVAPTADTWLVVMVRGGASMEPLHPSAPAAWSNAVLIDADGSGAYDDFPLVPGQPLRGWEPPVTRRPPTQRELADALWRLLQHEH